MRAGKSTSVSLADTRRLQALFKDRNAKHVPIPRRSPSRHQSLRRGAQPTIEALRGWTRGQGGQNSNRDTTGTRRIPQAPTAGAPPKPDRTVLTSMGPGARSPSVSREQPNALRSFRDFRLRGRRARGVRLASGQPQFAFAVESRANSAAGQARSPARSSSEPRRRRRRHPSFGWKRRLLKPKEESRDCWLLRWARNDGTD